MSQSDRKRPTPDTIYKPRDEEPAAEPTSNAENTSRKSAQPTERRSKRKTRSAQSGDEAPSPSRPPDSPTLPPPGETRPPTPRKGEPVGE
jgi:hypothetical protein